MAEKGVIGMLECLEYIRDHRNDEGGVEITTSLYSNSAYYFLNLELEVKVHHGGVTKYFHVEWTNPTEDNDEYPIKVNASTDSALDIFDLFMSIDDEISPETHEELLKLFDAVCDKERKTYALRMSADNNFQYIARLTDEKEIETNTDGILPFNYVDRFNELDQHLEEVTEYPPAELTTAADMVDRLREINNEKTIIIDIDYNLDATLIVVQAENNKSFSIGVDVIEDLELDEEEVGVATYYLMAMFMEATKDKEAFPDVTDMEIRQVARMLLEFQTNSSAEVASSTSKTTTKAVETVSTATTFRPATYSGVPADSHADASQGSSNGGSKKGKGKKNKNKPTKSKRDSAFPDYEGPSDGGSVYSSSSPTLWDDAYGYE